MRLMLAVAVVSMAGFGAGCGGGSSGYGGSGGTKPAACTADGATATTSVSISGMEFVPSCIKVSRGATVTFQNYFRLYKKLSGMTGTARTSAEEFHKVVIDDEAKQFIARFTSGAKEIRGVQHAGIHPYEQVRLAHHRAHNVVSSPKRRDEESLIQCAIRIQPCDPINGQAVGQGEGAAGRNPEILGGTRPGRSLLLGRSRGRHE